MKDTNQRQERYNELKSLPQFKMMDKVEITWWFYEWQKGLVYSELNFMRDPSQPVEELYHDWIVISYEIVIQDDKEETIAKREVETRHLKKID